MSEVIVDVDGDSPRTLADPTNGSNSEYDVQDGDEGLLIRRRGTVLTYSPFGASYGLWPMRRRSVQVTYTHGYDTIPADIKLITIVCAGRAFAQDGGVNESTGGYNVTYAGQPAMLTADERRGLDRYRSRRK